MPDPIGRPGHDPIGHPQADPIGCLHQDPLARLVTRISNAGDSRGIVTGLTIGTTTITPLAGARPALSIRPR